MLLCIRTAIRTWRQRDEHSGSKISGNFYNHMQLHNLFCYNNMMFLWCARRWGAWGERDQWILWILKCKYTFFMPAVLSVRLFSGDIFWSFMELNKRRRTKKRRSHWVQLIFIRLVLFCTNCSWNEIKWTAFWDFQVLMKIQFKVN